MNKKELKEEERLKAFNELREILKPKDTVYTKLNHVSRSGMYRVIEVFIIRNNEPWNITHQVATLLDMKQDSNHEYGLKVGGCGMDMGFSVVYDLSSALYRETGYPCTQLENGEYTRDHCPSNYHVNSHDWTNKGEPIHHDGYALKHRWL